MAIHLQVYMELQTISNAAFQQYIVTYIADPDGNLFEISSFNS